jgi:hypothetical protein
MGGFYEFKASGFIKNDLRDETQALGTVITFLAHDSYLKQLFAHEENNYVAIRVTDFESYPDSRVSWLSVSKQWIDKISILPNVVDYYFILSKDTYISMKSVAFGSNSISFRLGKNDHDGSIVAYVVIGKYSDYEGGGTTGLLHGARVPPV